MCIIPAWNMSAAKTRVNCTRVLNKSRVSSGPHVEPGPPWLTLLACFILSSQPSVRAVCITTLIPQMNKRLISLLTHGMPHYLCGSNQTGHLHLCAEPMIYPLCFTATENQQQPSSLSNVFWCLVKGMEEQEEFSCWKYYANWFFCSHAWSTHTLTSDQEYGHLA